MLKIVRKKTFWLRIGHLENKKPMMFYGRPDQLFIRWAITDYMEYAVLNIFHQFMKLQKKKKKNSLCTVKALNISRRFYTATKKQLYSRIEVKYFIYTCNITPQEIK